MNDEAKEFEHSLRRGLRDLGVRRGACPTPDRLSKYMEAALDDAELRSIEEHVALCGRCDSLMTKLEGFDEEASPSDDSDWQDHELPLPPSVGSDRSPWWRQVVSSSAAGWAVALAVLAFFLLRSSPTKPPSERTPPAWEIINVNDLNGTRSGGTGPGMIEVGNHFILSLFVPMSPEEQYLLSVDGSAAVPVAVAADTGTIHLLCRRDRFAAGTHRVTVRASNSGTEYSFPFTVP